MVSFKGKSTTNRLATSPRGVKNRFKVYSDLEKVQDENAMKNVEKQVMPLRKSLPVRKETQLTDRVDVLKVYDESSKHDTSVQSKAGRKALADVSNVKHSSLRTGVTKGSKAVKTAAKPLKPPRKSSLLIKGTGQTDSDDLLKRCNEYSRKSMIKDDSCGSKISGRKILTDINNTTSYSPNTGGSYRSKTIKVHNGKSLYMQRAAAAQSTKTATSSSRYLITGKSHVVAGTHIERSSVLKKVSAADTKITSGSQKTKESGTETRKTERKPHLLTRQSLPVVGRTYPIGSNCLENEKAVEKGGKFGKIKVGRKVAPHVNKTRKSFWKNRVSDSFISTKDKIGGPASLQGTIYKIAAGKNTISASALSRESIEFNANKSKIKELRDTKTNYNRRQSFTSSLLKKPEVLRKSFESTKEAKLPSIDDKLNELDVAEYVEDIYSYYWVMEVQYPLMANYMISQTSVTPKMRGILVNWLIEVHLKFGLMPETLFLMVALFDRFLSVATIEKNEIQLVGLTALLLASKYEDFWHPKVKELLSISLESYTGDQMLAMEKLILKKIMFRVNAPTPYVFMLRFLKAAQSDVTLEHLAFYLIELCLIEYDALKYKPSLLSASAIYVARCTLQMSPAWTLLLCKHAHYDESELRDCANMILKFHKLSGRGQLKVTYEKYIHSDQSSVAQIKPLDRLPQ